MCYGENPMPEKGKTENLLLSSQPEENKNLSGRRRDRPISDAYSEYAQKALPEELRVALHLGAGATFAQALAADLFAAASKGSVSAAREIREAIEGKADKRLSLVASGPVTIRVVYEPPLIKMMPKDSPGSPQK